jgi:hypothetical protein
VAGVALSPTMRSPNHSRAVGVSGNIKLPLVDFKRYAMAIDLLTAVTPKDRLPRRLMGLVHRGFGPARNVLTEAAATFNDKEAGLCRVLPDCLVSMTAPGNCISTPKE